MDEDERDSLILDVGDWIWGTVQGAFNERATLSQILVDAAIGMIPLVGDVTAVRDLIAVVLQLVQNPKKREDPFQWILLVVLILALIPVIGGVLKGVGRLVIKAAGEAAQLASAAAKAAKMERALADIIAFLNRVGFGNAPEWLARLRFADHQATILRVFNELTQRLEKALLAAKSRMWLVLPERMRNSIDGLVHGLRTVREMGERYIPDSIKKLDQYLREIQQYIRSGFERTSHRLPAGTTLTRVEELILLEGRGATRTARGGLAANSSLASDVANVYTHEAGFPDLLAYSRTEGVDTIYPNIATFAGQIVNREIEVGEQIYRVFGPAGTTHTIPIGASMAAGNPRFAAKFWGVGAPPASGEAWRQGAAVLDEWNRNGFIIVGTILDGASKPKACTGLIAEQFGSKLSGQYLSGGGKQAMLEVDSAIATELNQLGDAVIASGNAQTRVIGGISWEVRPTGWTDVNGVYGYIELPGPGALGVTRLGTRELMDKEE